MPNPILRGSLLPFLQYEENDFDPTRGYIYRAYFRGIGHDQMLSQQQDFVRLGIACRFRSEGGISTLEAEDSTQVYTLDYWQLVGNDESMDILSHPEMLAIATDTQIALMRGYLDQSKDPVVAFQDPGLASLSGTAAQRFYGLEMRGSTDFRQSQYVLRHTTNAPNTWAANIADFGINTIYTTGQLITEIGSSAFWINPAPYRLKYKINNIGPPASQTNYQWGWLKSTSTETLAVRNRIQIDTEYTLALWSTDAYPLYDGSTGPEDQSPGPF